MNNVQACSNAPTPEAVETFMARMPQHVLDRIAELTDQAADIVEAIRPIVYEYDRLSWTVSVLADDLHDGNGVMAFQEACGLEQLWRVVAAIAGPLEGNWHGVSGHVVAEGERIAREERPLRRAS